LASLGSYIQSPPPTVSLIRATRQTDTDQAIDQSALEWIADVPLTEENNGRIVAMSMRVANEIASTICRKQPLLY
jgi:hypothetical protein